MIFQKIKVAIIGSGNIGTELMLKILRHSQHLEIGVMVDIDPASAGLVHAASTGMATTHEGVEGLVRMPVFDDIDIAFDATSADAHLRNDRFLRVHRPDIRIIDLTPASIGPYCVPMINQADHVDARNVNMVTCAGQATIPIVAAISKLAKVHYAEIVASISSKSVGSGGRANIDEFTETTGRAVEMVGNAAKAKAIILLKQAEPRATAGYAVHCLSDLADEAAVEASINRTVSAVRSYVPGYRLKQKVQFNRIDANSPINIPHVGARMSGLKTSVSLEFESADQYPPSCGGNQEIMTAAAVACAERIAQRMTVVWGATGSAAS